MSYTPPSIRTVRQDIQQTVVLTGGQVTPAFVGTASAQQVAVKAQQCSMAAAATFTIPNLLPQGPVASILALRSLSVGGVLYSVGTDYTFDPVAQTIAFTSSSLAPPYLVSGTVSATGGSLASGTQYYVVTATKTTNLTGPVIGETAASNQLTVVLPANITTGSVALRWAPVPGAEGYKIYRSNVQGTFGGTSLLTTISGGYQTTFTDVGAATGAGTPPGAPLAGAVTGTVAGPFTLAANQTMVLSINGAGNLTATFTAVAASISDNASYPINFAGGEQLNVKIDGGTTQVVTFAVGAATTAITVAAAINTQLTGCSCSVVGGHAQIVSDKQGSSSSVQVTGGTANVVGKLNYSTTAVTGVGSNVANIAAVTTQEICTVGNAAFNSGAPTGATCTPTWDNKVLVQANTVGAGGSVHFISGAVLATVGLDTNTHTGSAGAAATALRRPALNGSTSTVLDKFYMDYTYAARQDFVVQRFTNLGLALSTFGLGTNLSVAITLAMGLSGSGNGASAVLAMSVPDNNLATYQAAFTFLGTRRDVDMVVPCVSDPTVFASLDAHCNFCSSEDQKRERFGIVGPAAGTVVGDETTSGTVLYMANSLDRRMMLVYPWAWVNVQQADYSFVNTELDGWAAAAAVAGLIAALPDRAEPATCKQIYGITALGGDTLDETTMNLLGGANVTVLTEEDGKLIIRDSLLENSDGNDADTHPNILLVEDFLRKTLRSEFASYRGRKILGSLLTKIQNLAKSTMDSFVKLALIAGYNPQSISAVQDPTNMTNVIVSFSYRPVFPLRTITFTYSFDLSTAALAA